MGVKSYLKKAIKKALKSMSAQTDLNSEATQNIGATPADAQESQQEKIRRTLEPLLRAQGSAQEAQQARFLRQQSDAVLQTRAGSSEKTDKGHRTAQPSHKTPDIPVVFICDDHYAIPTCVAITSLLCNKNEDTRYAVTVLGRALSEENVRRLRSLGEFVTVLACEGAKNACYANTHHYVSEAALLKFDIPQLLGQYDKVLYLDSDVLVLEDLSQLYATQLDNRYAAVVRDLLGMYYQFHTRTGVSAYFNSGVLLLNTRQMRKDRMTAKLFRNKANDPWKLLMDQDTLNVTFAENVVWLHPRYNLMYANNLESGWSMEQMATFYGISTQDMQETMLRPVIQHLSSKIKPWDNPIAEKYQDYQAYKTLFDRLLELHNRSANPKP